MFQIVQIIYWLSLSTWFGGVIFVAIAAPVIFRAVDRFRPTLPTVLSVNLENQHTTLLAGSIVADLLGVLVRVQLGCAIGAFVAQLGHWLLVDHAGSNLMPLALRAALYLAAVGMVIYDWRIVWPRVREAMNEYVDHADEPEVANPALDRFNHYQTESVTLMRNVSFLLLGMILFSTEIRPRPTFTPVRSTDAVTSEK